MVVEQLVVVLVWGCGGLSCLDMLDYRVLRVLIFCCFFFLESMDDFFFQDGGIFFLGFFEVIQREWGNVFFI